MHLVDPYKMLEVPKNFTMEQLRSQYKRLVLQHHPDKNIDVRSTPVFQMLTACYKMLVDEWKLRQDQRSHHELRAEANAALSAGLHHQNTKMVDPRQVSGKNFDANKFNKVFETERLRNAYDDGYEEWMNDPNSLKKYKNKHALVKYEEPKALPSMINSTQYQELGVNKVKDHSATNMSSRDLNFMDYRMAHSTDKLIDERLVDQRREYRNVQELEADRSRLAYTMTPEQLQAYHKKKLLQEREEEIRKQKQLEHDKMIEQHWAKTHRMMLGR
jgi:hypothetical protein